MDYHGFKYTDAFSLTRANLWCGMVAWLAFSLMVMTSFPFVRRRLFELFYYSHVTFKTIGLVRASALDIECLNLSLSMHGLCSARDIVTH